MSQRIDSFVRNAGIAAWNLNAEVALQIDAASIVELYAFIFEQPLLVFITIGGPKGDASFPVDHAVPRESVRVGACVENPRDLPGGPPVSGHARDLPVRGDPAGGNAADGFDHTGGERLVRLARLMRLPRHE